MPVQIGAAGQADFSTPIDLLMDCHRRVERFLAMLEKVVAAGLGGPLTDEQRRALVAGLDYFKDAAPSHTRDEEDSLFPRLRQSDDPRAAELLRRVEQLEADHQNAEPLHLAVDEIGRHWLEHNGLTGSQLRTLRDALAQLAAMYREHIAMEDEQVFPLARDLLDARQLESIAHEMQARRGL